MRKLLAILLLLTFCSTSSMAHEVRPAYLELKQQSEDAYQALWKVPALGDMRLGIYVRMPMDCEYVVEPRAFISGGAFIERWAFKSPGALVGDTIYFNGLKRTLTDVLVRIERIDGTTQVEMVGPSQPYLVVEAAPSKARIIWTYLVLGVEHIIFGIDHLLFVFALLLIVDGVGKLVRTITAFTVAHSITLATAALGFVHVPGPPVEAIIALSIAFVAMEILRRQQGKEGLTAKSPWLVAFTFGLLHGFGFAGALSEIGLPEQAIPLSLLFFNVGVEVGQLMFVFAIIAIEWVLKKTKVEFPKWAHAAPAYLIGSLAMFWVFERVAGFF